MIKLGLYYEYRCHLTLERLSNLLHKLEKNLISIRENKTEMSQ